MFGVSLHSLAIHFPIALAIFAFLYDGWAVYAHRPQLHDVGSGLSKFAALAAVVALGTGISLAGMSGLGSRSTVTGHAGLGLATVVILSAFAFTRQAAETRSGDALPVFSPVWLAVEGLAAILVAATAVVGHRI